MASPQRPARQRAALGGPRGAEHRSRCPCCRTILSDRVPWPAHAIRLRPRARRCGPRHRAVPPRRQAERGAAPERCSRPGVPGGLSHNISRHALARLRASIERRTIPDARPAADALARRGRPTGARGASAAIDPVSTRGTGNACPIPRPGHVPRPGTEALSSDRRAISAEANGARSGVLASDRCPARRGHDHGIPQARAGREECHRYEHAPRRRAIIGVR
jgi:hypothetical protein